MAAKEIRQAFAYLDDHKGRLTPGQINFIDSLKKYFKRNKTLSDKQQQILFELRECLKLKIK